ncbi:BTAD domain-containing putative transcriptional regulator [Nonomuraea insulae]|uniref:BTAD domain-containing putative transcriptional regulator n=1 Tax=Nonomuraea insulae TaxID=1616787 RepID=A0ABW1CUV6_9ACTN
MRMCFLGPLRVYDGDRLLSLGGPKQRLVLAHLVIRVNQVVPVERLIDEIWADRPPESARSTLQSYVSHLRKALGGDRIESHGRGYALRIRPDEADGLLFEAKAGEGRRLLAGDPQAAAAALREALGLWQGPPFADLSSEPSLRTEIGRLEELRLSVTEDQVGAELEQGHHGRLVSELEALTAAHPLRERLCGQLMLALYRSGRQAEALVSFERSRRLLSEELGIDPSPDLRRLHEQILRQDVALQPGRSALRGYQLVERIGEGGFGVVWRAVQPEVDREVAIKAIHPRLANRPEFVREFEAEAQLVAKVEHPHVVPLYDFWREPGGAYLVMRLLRGGSLRTLLDRSGPPSAEAAGRMVEQVTRALAAAHGQGVIHRDVRPSNVLLDEEGNAYLSDFGIATETAQTGSPDRRRDGPSTPSTDVHAMGIMMGQLLPTPSGTMRKVIERATAADPGRRYRDATELLAAVLAARSGVRASGLAARNPYKGLRPFTETDAADFFGREALTARLLARLREDRFLAVVGPSGSGKSSVVRAGLVPALRAGAVTGSEHWYVARMTPGARPWEELQAALRAIAIHSPGPLAEASDLTAALPGDHGELLLVIDQFEELFTLVADEGQRRGFLSALLASMARPSSRLRVVITLRADFYDRPLQYAQLAALIRSHTEVVVPLTAEEVERAVTEPARRSGVTTAPGLVAEIAADVANQPGALPLLQYALAELFDRRRNERLTPSAYRDIGRISEALARRADEVFVSLPRRVQEAARQLFLRLLTVGDGAGDTRRRVPQAELLSLEHDPRDMQAAIDAFGAARLLSFDRDPDTRGPTAEVAHEALLREWKRLRDWIAAAREDVRTERWLAGATHDWLVAARDDSFLVSGTRLDRLEVWRATSDLAVTPDQEAFVRTSLSARERDEEEEERRKARERALERRSIRRLRTLVAVLTTTAVIMTGLVVFAYGQRERAEGEARTAAARELAASAVGNLETDPELSILLALEAVKRTRVVNGSVLPEAEDALHRAVTAARIVLSVTGVGGAVDWSSDGRLFSSEGIEDSGIVDIRNAGTGASLLRFRGHGADVNDVTFSPDSTMLATTGDDGTAKIWDTRTGRELVAFTYASGAVWAPSFSPDGSLLAATWRDNGVTRVMEIATGRTIRTFRPAGRAFTARFSPDGKHVAMALNEPRDVLVADVSSGRTVRTLRGHTWAVEDVDWSPDGRRLATYGGEGFTRIWDTGTGKVRSTLYGHTGTIAAADWSPDSGRLITASDDGTAKLWEVDESGYRQVLSLSGTQDSFVGAAFSPDGNRVLTGDFETGAAKIWDVSRAGAAEWLNVPANPTAWSAVAFTPDGHNLLATGTARSVNVWDLRTGTAGLVLGEREGPPTDSVYGIDVSRDGTLVAAGTSAFDVNVWQASSGERLFAVPHTSDPHWSPDGRTLAMADEYGGVKLVDRSGGSLGALPGEPGLNVDRLSFSPDGRLLACVEYRYGRPDPAAARVKIWDWRQRRLLRSIHLYGSSIDFDATGTRIVVGEPSGLAGVWEVASGQKILTLTGHQGPVYDAVFSPDGTRIATGSADSTVRLWHADSGLQSLTLRGHEGGAYSVRFSPDGSRLAVGSGGGTVRVWALDLDDLIGIARANVTRTLTGQECRQYLHARRCPSA